MQGATNGETRLIFTYGTRHTSGSIFYSENYSNIFFLQDQFTMSPVFYFYLITTYQIKYIFYFYFFIFYLE